MIFIGIVLAVILFTLPLSGGGGCSREEQILWEIEMESERNHQAAIKKYRKKGWFR